MRIQLSATALLLASLALVGCSASAGPASETQAETAPGSVSDAETAPEPGAEPSADHASSLALISSCAYTEPVLAPYIDGLVQAEGNSVNEYGVQCTWTMPEDNTDWANAREVSLSIVPTSVSGTPKPDIEGLKQFMPNITELTHEWVASQSGVAYETSLGSDTIGAITSVVWTPEVEVTVGGGSWANQPSLDGNAAIAVAQQLLG